MAINFLFSNLTFQADVMCKCARFSYKIVRSKHLLLQINDYDYRYKEYCNII